jgi:hypothetical protein
MADRHAVIGRIPLSVLDGAGTTGAGTLQRGGDTDRPSTARPGFTSRRGAS